MELSENMIRELAQFCRLHLRDGEAEMYRRDLEGLTLLASPLLSVPHEADEDLEDGEVLGIREDKVRPSIDRDVILSAAPHVRNGYIVVPRTVEE